MPMGHVTRWNDTTGHGLIETKTGRYAVSADAIDEHARFAGAHVTFDVVHEDPMDRAINVQLREGTRHDPKQRRFGDAVK